jgi:hypothetical protein
MEPFLSKKVVFGHKNTANKQPPKKLLFRGESPNKQYSRKLPSKPNIQLD